VLAPSGKSTFTPNYNGANVSALKVNASTGVLTLVSGSPFGAGSGSTAFTVDSTGKFGYSMNSGASNISAYKIGSSGTLTAVKGSPFATDGGPEWMAVCKCVKNVCKPPSL
jgi:6-phosphogluconolactonase